MNVEQRARGPIRGVTGNEAAVEGQATQSPDGGLGVRQDDREEGGAHAEHLVGGEEGTLRCCSLDRLCLCEERGQSAHGGPGSCNVDFRLPGS